MVTITPAILRAIAKAAHPSAAPKAEVINGIAQWWHVAEAGGIDTREEAAGFLGQSCLETDYFKTLKEYWGPTETQQGYEGRDDLGNTKSGDGKRFMGRGIFQYTGRYNYQELSDHFGVDFIAKPQLLETPEWSMKSAVFYWRKKKLEQYAAKRLWNKISRGVNRGNPNHKRKANHEVERFRASEAAFTLLGSKEPEFVVNENIILEVQTLLAAKGWPEVGKADGKAGARTDGAILSYRNEQVPPLPLTTAIDAALLHSLRTGPDRKVSVVRAGTTATDLKEAGEPTILTAGTIKTAAGAGGLLSLFGGVDQQGLTDRAKEAVAGAGALRETAEEALNLIQWAAQKWWIPVLLLCAFLIWKSSKIVKQRVDDYRTGKTPGV